MQVETDNFTIFAPRHFKVIFVGRRKTWDGRVLSTFPREGAL
jgi:hypothetical protein